MRKQKSELVAFLLQKLPTGIYVRPRIYLCGGKLTLTPLPASFRPRLFHKRFPKTTLTHHSVASAGGLRWLHSAGFGGTREIQIKEVGLH